MLYNTEMTLKRKKVYSKSNNSRRKRYSCFTRFQSMFLLTTQYTKADVVECSSQQTAMPYH